MLRAVQLPQLGWLIKRPGFHREAGFSSGPAFIVGLAFRSMPNSLVPPICSVAKRDRISTVLFLQRIIVESHSQRILTP